MLLAAGGMLTSKCYDSYVPMYIHTYVWISSVLYECCSASLLVNVQASIFLTVFVHTWVCLYTSRLAIIFVPVAIAKVGKRAWVRSSMGKIKNLSSSTVCVDQWRSFSRSFSYRGFVFIHSEWWRRPWRTRSAKFVPSSEYRPRKVYF